MSSHQTNQANPQVSGTYQYQWGDQVLEIPSNINYQLENVLTSGGVSIAYIFIESYISRINNFENECISLTNILNNLTYKSTFNMWNHIRMRTHNLDPASLIIFILCLYVIYLFMCKKHVLQPHA
jgi:hypothetical protein